MKTPAEMLDHKFKHGDFAKKLTFRQFFKLLLTAVWDEEEGFSGKRPFGNSGWTYAVYEGLDANGGTGEMDHDAFVFAMIDAL